MKTMKKIAFSKRYGLEQAVIARLKNKTRRIIKGDFEDVKAYHANGCWHFIADTKDGDSIELKPTYEMGETVAIAQSYEDVYLGFSNPQARHEYSLRVSCLHHTGDLHSIAGWTNKMFVKSNLMPNRIRITDIKLKRLQDISEEDAIREGVEKWMDGYIVTGIIERWQHHNVCFDTPREAFAALIDKLSGKGTWESNPWVFDYEFVLLQ